MASDEQSETIRRQQFRSLGDLATFLVAAASSRAMERVKPHIVSADDGGAAFMLDAGVAHLANDAPEAAKNAANFLTARRLLLDGRKVDDSDQIEIAAFLAGYYANDAILSAETGKSGFEMFQAFTQMCSAREMALESKREKIRAQNAIGFPVIARHLEQQKKTTAAFRDAASEIRETHRLGLSAKQWQRRWNDALRSSAPPVDENSKDIA